jgi:tetratricopeptide (TPR) repeat protein
MASSVTDNPKSERALVSWKEIASFLNRGERTVKRWETERGLPVRRVPGGERGSVYAYPSELNAWLSGEQMSAAQTGSVSERDGEIANSSPPERHERLEDVEPSLAGKSLTTAANWKALIFRPALIWATAPAIMLVVAAASIYVFRAGNRIDAEARSAVPDRSVADHIPAPTVERLYLHGRYEWGLRTADSLVKSMDDYTQAIVQDSNYAPAYAGLAESYDLLPEYGRMSREEAFSRAKSAAQRAIALDPNLAAAHRARAFALFFGDWDAPASDAEFKLALALAPNEMESHHWYATTLFSRLEAAHAISEIDEAVRLSPTTPAVVADAAFIHAFFNQDRESNMRTLREMTQTQPKLASPSRYLAELDLDDGNFSDYLADLRIAASVSHDPYEEALAAGASAGWTRAGRAGLLDGVRRVQEDAFAHGNETGYWLGRTYLMLGDPITALRYFDQAFQKNDFTLMTLSACPCVAGLTNDARYADLLRRVREQMHLRSPAPSSMPTTTHSEAPPSF